jgi:signal transduction histidine kinase
VEAILELPPMADPEREAALRVTAASSFLDVNLYCVHVARMAALSLEGGLCASSSLWFGSVGFILARYFDDPVAAHRFALVALQLAERRGDRASRGRARFFLVMTSYWTGTLSEVLGHARSGLEDALETGDIVVAGYLRVMAATALMLTGETLQGVAEQAQAGVDFARHSGLRDIEDVLVIQRQLARSLQGRTSSLASLDDAGFDERRFEAGLTDGRMSHLVCWYWVVKMRAAFTAGDHPQALEAGRKADQIGWAIAGHTAYRDLRLYQALTLAALATQAPPDERAAQLQAIEGKREELARWARVNPGPFSHSELLIAAELARLRGEPRQAARLYEDSLRAAREGGFVQDEALAYELAAPFHRAEGFPAFADLYLREARARYRRWGAEGKVRALERQHPQALAAPDPLPFTSTWRARAEQIDLLSVAKASQAISQEMARDRLLERLMQVVLAQGGASQGCLLLQRQGALSIEAEAVLEADRARVSVLQGEPATASRLPLSILQYTWRTGESVVLTDAGEEDRFSADEYLRRVRPRSVLCLAIERQRQVVGLLYLENRALPGAFTGERLMVLELLAAQAAISLENARALAEAEAARAAAEQAVRARDEFLSIASHELNTPMSALMLSLESLLEGTGGALAQPEIVKKLGSLAERQGRRLTRLIRDLLDVTRLDRGGLELKPERVELGALVRETLVRFRPELVRARTEAALEVAEEVVGRWDPARLDQVVVNLLSNAAKFGAGQPIAVRVGRRGAWAWLQVIDHGIGIDTASQGRIFERFERGVSAEHYGGLGLGLYISRRIVEAHGGSLGVHSVPGEGSTFTIELPCPAEEGRS